MSRWVALAVAVVALGVVAVVAVVAGGGDDETSGSTTTTEATTTAPADSGCEQVDAPAARDPETRDKPTAKLDASKTYRLVFATNCGSFTVELDLDRAPNASASLVALAQDGYFDDTIFHRIVPGFVIQGGDPTQTGGGGPGYSTVDVPPQDAMYAKGMVAMAKTADEAPGTAGSQFFVVTADDANLPPEYAIVGKVTTGIDVVERIGALGDASEQPTQPVVIDSVTVETA